ncbi:MAG: leucine-rich repeat protein, partial [Oscillospiraceae bacterium]|nr:leucine-rich repeat protein [Oscillospiraceae bacterium]
FLDCSSLVSVTLPTGCTRIGSSAFSGCSKLSKINIPDIVTEIGSSAFNECSSISGDIALPSSLVTLGDAAYANCSRITKFIVPNKVSTVGSNAFHNCSSLKYVYFGKSVSKIGDSAFRGCSSIQKLFFGGSYVKLNGVFDYDSIPSVYYPSTYSTEWSNYSGTKTKYTATTSVTVSGNKTLAAGSSMTVKATAKPANSLVGDLYYFSSSDPSVATVNANGVVTALKGGKVTITATSITGKSGSITISTLPKKVTGLKATSATANSVKLTWNASSGVAGYYVYRSTSATTGFKKVATVATNSYTDKGLTKGTKYYYSIRAYVKSGSSTLQSALCASKGITATSPAPSSVKATKSSSGVAKLSWAKCVGAEGYQVAYSTSANGTYKSAGYVKSGSTLSARKKGLTAGKTYYFKVRSYITVNGKKVYSAFSTTVRVKVR